MYDTDVSRVIQEAKIGDITGMTPGMTLDSFSDSSFNSGVK